MAFGQASGPPARAQQIERLGELLQRAGFSSFREARHPYGLTQRQAAGKFSTGEADELIERLEAAEVVTGGEPDGAEAPPDPATGATTSVARAGGGSGSGSTREAREKRLVQQLTKVPEPLLVAELERRGWCCIAPLPEAADGE